MCGASFFPKQRGSSGITKRSDVAVSLFLCDVEGALHYNNNTARGGAEAKRCTFYLFAEFVSDSLHSGTASKARMWRNLRYIMGWTGENGSICEPTLSTCRHGFTQICKFQYTHISFPIANILKNFNFTSKFKPRM